jgi:hypothetical protein
LTEVSEIAPLWRAASRVVLALEAVRHKCTAYHKNFDRASIRYWREIGKRAWSRALRKAWGGTFGITEATVVPILIATFVGALIGSATGNWVAGAGAGLATAGAWTAFFFVVNLVALPARVHADLVYKLNLAREEI